MRLEDFRVSSLVGFVCEGTPGPLRRNRSNATSKYLNIVGLTKDSRLSCIMSSVVPPVTIAVEPVVKLLGLSQPATTTTHPQGNHFQWATIPSTKWIGSPQVPYTRGHCRMGARISEHVLSQLDIIHTAPAKHRPTRKGCKLDVSATSRMTWKGE